MKTHLLKSEIVLKIVVGLLIYLLLLVFSQSNAQNLLQYPQSVVCDMAHNRYILSNVLSTDLVAIDTAGNQSYFVRDSKINFGMTIYGNVLYGVGDRDKRLRGYDLETGALVLNVNFPGASLLWAVAADTSGNLYLTQAAPPGRIFKYSLRDSVASVFMNGIPTPDGIVYDAKHDRLIYDTYGVVNHPIKAIDLQTLSITTLANTTFTHNWCIIKDEYERYYIQDSNYHIWRYDSTFINPPELFYHSTIPGGGMIFIDYDSIRNCIAITLSDVNSWARIPVTPPTSVREITGKIPGEFELMQNYPNPFNPSTTINFKISKNEFVTLKVFDILGKEIATLVNEKLNAGKYEVIFSGNNFPSGIYFYRIHAGKYKEIKTMMLIK